MNRNKLSTLFGKNSKNIIFVDKTTQCNLFEENIESVIKIINQLPRFNGINQDFQSYVKCFKLKVRIFELNEKAETDILLNCIDGEAMELVTKHLQIGIKTWNELIQELNDIFSHLTDKKVTIQLLRERKQNSDETIDIYGNSIIDMVNNLFTLENGYDQKLKEKEIIRYFIRGIRPQLKKQLKGKYFNSFQQLKQYALKCENNHER